VDDPDMLDALLGDAELLDALQNLVGPLDSEEDITGLFSASSSPSVPSPTSLSSPSLPTPLAHTASSALDADLTDAESVVSWMSRDSVFDEAPTLQYISRRIMRRIATNGPTEGSNAGVAGIRTKKRNSLKDETLDDVALVMMVGDPKLPRPKMENVLRNILKKPRNIKQKCYEHKNNGNKNREDAEDRHSHNEDNLRKENESEDIYCYTETECENDEMRRKKMEERQQEIINTPEAIVPRRAKDAFRKSVNRMPSVKQKRMKGVNKKRKRKREKVYEDEVVDKDDGWYNQPSNGNSRALAPGSWRRHPHRQKKTAGLMSAILHIFVSCYWVFSCLFCRTVFAYPRRCP
jgi:hypothetical protein